MPRANQLPEHLQAIVRRQAVGLSHNRLPADSKAIISSIKRAFERAAAEQRQREEKERLEAEQRQREKKERLEAEQRQHENERLLNECREKDRLEAERLETERRRRSEGLARVR